MKDGFFFFMLGWILVLADGWIWHTHVLAAIGVISLIGSFYLFNLQDKDE